ncbi:MAG TPA: M20/M25/M40 family metallo-hydrolase [Bryobacteraceae bacterium]|nr:M20/M25/M40 family metallo-hydrolase [Bryobacteraceae bacterium]
MHLFQLTRALIDIESITENEERIGSFLFDRLSELAARFNGQVERMPVAGKRFNVLAIFGDPLVTLSTHMDTVPPFFPSSEDEEFIHGRGACDTKGIIAAMITAATQLLEAGIRGLALLFVVGEERNSAGAYIAAANGRGSRFLINGEPTENKLALGSKGALRVEVVAHGRMAHSAYPELGESAIEKLLDALSEVRRVELPTDGILGASTLNIGTLSGGRAPNVIPDRACAEIMIRLVDDGQTTRVALARAVQGRADLDEVLAIPAVHLGSIPGLDTTVVAFTTDIPAFEGAWGQPFLIGPGTIHVAHTAEERVPKREVAQAVDIYKHMVQYLMKEG